MKQLKAVEHYIERPRKPVLREKQVFLVILIGIECTNFVGFSEYYFLS